LDVGDRRANCCNITSNHAVVEVEEHEVERPLTQVEHQGMQSACEKQGPQGIALLDATGRQQGRSSKVKV
jgi:hypothetical protein